MGSVEAPKIILYTSYFCPWAHRSQVILKELGLDFETVHIDLSTPRTAEYLKINPRGLVPTINYNGDIVTESGIISHFLADAHPSHLVKTSSESGGALQRARIEFFVDTYFSKVNSLLWTLQLAEGAEQEAVAAKFVEAVVKEIEPLLQDAKPFFGGSDKFTLAEVQTASFLLRVLELPDYGILPKSLTKGLEAKAPAFWKWANAVIAKESVRYIWNAEQVADRTKAKIAQLKEQAASK